MTTTLLDEMVAAVDGGQLPSRAAVEQWLQGLASSTAAAQELALVRQQVAALRPAAAEQVDAALAVVLEAALQHVTQQATDAALNDAVTELPTRRLFERDSRRALATAARSGRPVSVVMVDVDGLKKVNDLQGHAAGDAHLRGVAEALRSVVREGDGAYRIGGDEFALLLADADEAAADRVMSRFAGPPVSWGVATSAAGATDGDALLATADARMYRTRQDRRRPVTPPPRPRGRTAGLAAVAAALATLSTVGLMTVATGSAVRDGGRSETSTDAGGPAGGAWVAPVRPQQAATSPAPPAQVAPAVAAPAPVAVRPAPPAPVVVLPVAVPTLPVPLPTAPAVPLPQPSADPGAVTTVVDETVTLVERTVCSLLC